MEFFLRSPAEPSRLAVLPGAFNPPTRAHFALAQAALGVADQVLFVLPRAFPHKHYEGASFEDRVRMLAAAAEGDPRLSIAAAPEGLFIDIARACRAAYPALARLYIVCGCDAARRAVEWDYGQPGAFARMLDEFELLVADRQGHYEPPPELRHRIHPLPLGAGYGDISATEVRERIRSGRDWLHLVPPAIAEMARGIYARGAEAGRG